LVVVSGALLGGVEPAKEMAPPEAPVVQVSQPLLREITDYETFVGGHLVAIQNVDLRARVTGYIEKVNFKTGAAVKRGDVLFEIDPQTYQTALDRATAQLHREEARWKLASKELDRAKLRHEYSFVTEAELNRIESEEAITKSEVEAAKATVALAKRNLVHTKITSPINGKIGRPLVEVGNIVRADETAMVFIISVDPIAVSFDVDEKTMLKLAQQRQGGKIKSYTELPIRVQLCRVEDSYPHQGKVETIDVQVDRKTSAVRWRALLPNKDGLLMPGTEARVRMATSAPYKVLTVAEQAYHSNPNVGSWLFVVNEKNIVERRKVDYTFTGDEFGAYFANLKEGVKPGEWVVVNGPPDLKEGMTVKPEKVAMPTTEEKPITGPDATK
jgi:RND family efflux transporter MFP subunit